MQQIASENADLNQQLEELGITYRGIEQQLVEAKLQAATLDMEADQLSVELTQKNGLLKKFSSKCTKLEIELVQLQAQSGEPTDESAEGDHNDNAAVNMSPPKKQKGAAAKMKSFFANKFKKGKKDAAGSANNSGRGDSGRGQQNPPIDIQD